MKPNMIYLHGFANQFYHGSKKVQAFSEHYNIIPYSYNSALNYNEILEDISQTIEQKNISTIAGNCLGGYFALQLSEFHENLFSIALNPPTNPQRQLERFLGVVECFKANKEFLMTRDILESYPDHLSKQGHGLILIKKDDDFFDYPRCENSFPSNYDVMVLNGSDHGFKDIEKHTGYIYQKHLAYLAL